jgi:transposase
MVAEMDQQIQQWHRTSEASQRLAAIAGIGPITATAMVASIGDARSFRNGRQLAAWLGLVPRQHSSGGKSLLVGISKRGDCYLRTLLIHGARACDSMCPENPNKIESDRGNLQFTQWLQALLARRGSNVAAVALANKNARMIWALLAHERCYQLS